MKFLATTPSNAASASFQTFKPDFVVCDESGQCVEGDHMIAMTKETVKAVVLIGDQKQSPPTLISENEESPESNYIKRSLMENHTTIPHLDLSYIYLRYPYTDAIFTPSIIKGLETSLDLTSASRSHLFAQILLASSLDPIRESKT